jgi:hypothetical protein
MTSTKRINVKYSENEIQSLYFGIMNKKKSIEIDIATYEKQSNKEFPLEFIEKKKVDNYDYVNPDHYKQDDGKQTWERMVDKYGVEKTAIFCELNAFKYQDRIGKKPNEDVEREQNKINWYNEKAKDLFLKVTKKFNGFLS